MSDADAAIVDVLRAIMGRKGLKLTEMASQIGVPYRSMQNYFAKRSPMPLSVYISACAWLGITPEYPVKEKFGLDEDALSASVADVLGGELLNAIEFGDDLSWRLTDLNRATDAARIRRNSKIFAHLIASRYDLRRELSMREPE